MFGIKTINTSSLKQAKIITEFLFFKKINNKDLCKKLNIVIIKIYKKEI